MSANPVFTQALADATQRQVELSPVIEATTLGAAFLAGMAVGVWKDTDDVARAWSPRAVVEPGRATDRARWYAARDRAREWVPELSSLNF
jgi:glycerol kinase